MGELIRAPWNDDQIDSLNSFQRAGVMHEFTCGNSRGMNPTLEHSQRFPLVATKDGWICPYCDYTQDWAHDFMADWSWLPRTKSWLTAGYLDTLIDQHPSQ
jgi:hypothetical protein